MVLTEPRSATSRARDAIEQAGLKGPLEDVPLAAMGATKDQWVSAACPVCETVREFPVPFPDHKTRLLAWEKIVERLLGKPKETTEVTLTEKPFSEMTTEELLARVHAGRSDES